ncbi:ABC transporter ATP-binding protein [Agrococcus sp. ProA11]|uniref:ABC transporter ATP-binding protein n=1 Tax=Agrococcus chionoecetis TaxID=3153752 RepID=UPI0032605E52
MSGGEQRAEDQRAEALDVEALHVRFPRVGEVLHDVDLRVSFGECVAVVGGSGAGKSVLARTILALAGPTAHVEAARFTFAGRDVRHASARTWRAIRGREVSLVLQDAMQSLDPLRTIEAEVGEALAVRRTPRRERRQRIVAALEHAGLPRAAERLRQRSGQLSGGMRQRALIASALVGGARLVVADEPTTALDATVGLRVLELLGRTRDAGAALVLVTHDLDAVARLADRVVVLDRGRVIEQGSTARVLQHPQHPVTRALIAAVPRGAKARSDATPGEVLISASGLRKRYAGRGAPTVTALDDVDVAVRAGEVLGVVGASGSGKTTLARMLVGAERPDGGRVHREHGARVRFVPQDPLGSFDPRLTVEKILRHSGARSPAELLEQVHLAPSVLDRRPAQLSGGQRQRVSIARALAARPHVLVCDEPVSALDVTTQAGILELLLELQSRGVAIVFISHDLAVIRQVSDRIAVMRDGAVVEEGATEQLLAAPQHPFTRELVLARA